MGQAVCRWIGDCLFADGAERLQDQVASSARRAMPACRGRKRCVTRLRSGGAVSVLMSKDLLL